MSNARRRPCVKTPKKKSKSHSHTYYKFCDQTTDSRAKNRYKIVTRCFCGVKP